MFGDEIEAIVEFDPLTGEKTATLSDIIVYANSHYVTPRPTMQNAIQQIKTDLKQRLDEFNRAGRLLEAQRLEQRTIFDIEMMETTGACAGIENYSRYLTGRKPGEPPPTLFEYFPENSLLIVDESHVTVPQIGGMFRGDFNRKSVLAEFGFRLPSAIDNRPLKFEEWERCGRRRPSSAPRPARGRWSAPQGVFIEQVIRPTGLIDPTVIIRPVEKQVDDLIAECKDCAKKGERVLVTVLTKRMAEDLVEYLHEAGIRCRYLHSDIDTLERIEIIRDLRLGAFDVLVGINLLREGLDIPECALVAILDADKEGFLRSPTSLVQTIGRAARNIDGRVILYADKMTDSIKYAIAETDRRRAKQRPTTRRTASRRPRSRRTSTRSCSRPPSATITRSTPACRATSIWSATICAATSPSWRSACATPPPTSNSRRPRASATRSAGSRPTSSSCPARPPAPMSASISAACRTAACSAACAPARAAPPPSQNPTNPGRPTRRSGR